MNIPPRVTVLNKHLTGFQFDLIQFYFYILLNRRHGILHNDFRVTLFDLITRKKITKDLIF
jgi:hypothetical protein